jgi:hypothetical protein
LSKEVYDTCLKNFYQQFTVIFDKCETEFQRKIFCASEFLFYSKKDPDEIIPDWFSNYVENPVLEEAG